jgi:hypothetical protein
MLDGRKDLQFFGFFADPSTCCVAQQGPARLETSILLGVDVIYCPTLIKLDNTNDYEAVNPGGVNKDSWLHEMGVSFYLGSIMSFTVVLLCVSTAP